MKQSGERWGGDFIQHGMNGVRIAIDSSRPQNKATGLDCKVDAQTTSCPESGDS